MIVVEDYTPYRNKDATRVLTQLEINSILGFYDTGISYDIQAKLFTIENSSDTINEAITWLEDRPVKVIVREMSHLGMIFSFVEADDEVLFRLSFDIEITEQFEFVD